MTCVVQVASEELIQVARLGQHAKVVSMLQGGAVYPDVMDASRHTPLFAAAVSSFHQVYIFKPWHASTRTHVVPSYGLFWHIYVCLGACV